MSHDNPIITENMTVVEAAAKLAKGNPGAAQALLALMRDTAIVDPDCIFEEWAPLFDCDHLDLYGPDIWILYKDICKFNTANMLAVFRAVQFGQISAKTVQAAVASGRNGSDLTEPLDIPKILENVKKKLPNFGKRVGA